MWGGFVSKGGEEGGGFWGRLIWCWEQSTGGDRNGIDVEGFSFFGLGFFVGKLKDGKGELWWMKVYRRRNSKRTWGDEHTFTPVATTAASRRVYALGSFHLTGIFDSCSLCSGLEVREE